MFDLSSNIVEETSTLTFCPPGCHCLINIIAVSASEVFRFRSTEPIKSAVSKLLSMRSNPEAKVEGKYYWDLGLCIIWECI